MLKISKVTKLDGIRSWSLPAVSTCPGARRRLQAVTGKDPHGSTILPSTDFPTNTFVCRSYENKTKEKPYARCDGCRACWDKSVPMIGYIAHGTTAKKVIKRAGSKITDSVLVDACSMCYAVNGNYRFKNVVDAREHNRLDWQREDWVDEMVAMINRLPVIKGDSGTYFRWLDSGDIYHVGLARKILAVCRLTPDCKHWIPTRSMKVEKIAVILRQINALPNVMVRFSSDSVLGEFSKTA